MAPLEGVDEYCLSPEDAKNWLQRMGELRKATDVVLATLAHVVDVHSQRDLPAGHYARGQGFSGAAGLVAQAADVGIADAGKLVRLGDVLAAGDRADAAARGDGAGGDLFGGGFGDRGPDGAGAGGAGLPGAGAAPVAGPPERFAYLARAVREHALGMEKANVIRRTLEDFTIDTTEIEVSLVDRARGRTLDSVRKMCKMELARSDKAGLAEREARNRDARYLRFYDDNDGMVTVHGKLDPITAGPLRTLIDTRVRAEMVTERKLKDAVKRDPGQIAADVLAEIARHCLGCQDPAAGTKTTMVVRVALEDLEAGVGLATCDGVEGPVSIATLRAMAVDAQVIPAVMGKGPVPLDIGRANRLFTPMQRIAIAERDGGCAKCGAPVARCDVHHIVFWKYGGPTDINNALMLCVGCHHRLHDYGWEVEIDSDGVVWFIPPAEVDPLRRRQPSSPTRHTA